MIVQHNMSAANANRQLGINATNLSKSTEKLSSGYRINRAGDDAAGLSISEKMRGQIRGLDQASTNAQDGISLIQTAEGALDETHNILQRMRELSVQAANDTNAKEDRTAIEEEITQLTKEIDRIADTTQFNTKNLIDGSYTGTFQIGANSGQTLTVNIDSMNSGSLGLKGGIVLNKQTGVTNANELAEGTYTVKGSNLLDDKGNVLGTFTNAADKTTITLANSKTVELTTPLNEGAQITVSNKGTTNADVQVTLGATAGNKLSAGDYKISGTNLLKDGELVGTTTTAGGKEYTLTDGITKVDLSSLGLASTDYADGDTFTIKSIDVSTSTKASGALDTIDAAIKTVSKQRSALGAVQNRLEHTISNLDNSSENLQSAESRIRDVDMAEEMVKYSKSSILQQASQSMLAQAKNSTQGVLSLLQ
ncbi:MAG: flagellin [bacterium]|nr:flagellin [bacterium]